MPSPSYVPRVFYLDRASINTDELIPAKYLRGVSRRGLGEHLLEDLSLKGFDPQDPKFLEASVLVAGPGFGSGSSREHAVWALQGASFIAVIAPSFERIFRENALYCGFPLLEVPESAICDLMARKLPYCSISYEHKEVSFSSSQTAPLAGVPFRLADAFVEQLVAGGGYVEFMLDRYGQEEGGETL